MARITLDSPNIAIRDNNFGTAVRAADSSLISFPINPNFDYTAMEKIVTYPKDETDVKKIPGIKVSQMKEIFVFGSNLAGRHGAGSAKEAIKNHGAVYGKGAGIQGNSYAIPTKDERFNVLPLKDIKSFVNEFIRYVSISPDTIFNIVAIGTGLAGYTHEEMAPLFENAPSNCNLPLEWKEILDKKQIQSFKKAGEFKKPSLGAGAKLKYDKFMKTIKEDEEF